MHLFVDFLVVKFFFLLIFDIVGFGTICHLFLKAIKAASEAEPELSCLSGMAATVLEGS